jgi:hypothetical protein
MAFSGGVSLDHWTFSSVRNEYFRIEIDEKREDRCGRKGNK